MVKYSLKTQQKYIDQTRALDSERGQLVAQLKGDSLPDNEVDRILKRLNSIYQAQASNAIILSDMLTEAKGMK